MSATGHSSQFIGSIVSHYIIEAELGRGGMGVVYRARDQRLLRNVALKMIPGYFADAGEQRARIMAEARAASALAHPGIAAVYDVGEHDGKLFIVMELVSGTSLRDIIDRKPLTPMVAARIGAELASILHCAHQQGVVHGDVKPENIFILPDGHTKLLDFGLAHRNVQQSTTQTTPVPDWMSNNQVVGTIAYMAPECFRGLSNESSDLYALGVVLYEAISGIRPFPGDNAAALLPQILHSAVAPLEKIAPSTPVELANLVSHLLEKDPTRRPESASDVHLELKNFLRNAEAQRLPSISESTQPTIAVLPFKLMTPDPNLDYLGPALADSTIHNLSATGKVAVRPLSNVVHYGKQVTDPAAVARELNVDTIVDGSIQKLGNRIRVFVHGWKSRSSTAIFSEKFEADANDLFTLQDELGDGIREKLGLKTHDTAPVEQPTKNSVAYELYLRAADRLARLNRWDIRTAVEMLENATRLDPDFALAWARMAEACVLMSVGFDPNPKWIKEAERASKRALQLDPANAAAHCVKGQILWSPARKFQNTPALRALALALQLNPGNHRARQWQSLIFFHIGLLKEARQGLQQVLRSVQDDVFTLVFLGQVALYAGNYDEADEFNGRSLSLDRAHIWSNCFYPTISLYKGELDRAEKLIAVARQVLPDDSWLTCCEGLLWAKRGDNKKALKYVEKAIRDNNVLLHTHHMWHTAAATYSLIGMPARAIALLERCNKLGLPNYDLFCSDPHLAPLKDQQRFRTLLSLMKREHRAFKKEFGGSE